GVRDSKTVTDAMALSLSTRIARVCPHHVVSIGPAKYNELYANFKNLNHLLAWAHARAIENVLEHQSASRIVSDEFAKGGAVVRTALGAAGKEVEFVSRVRAESDPAVAAASILARAQFLRKLKSLSEEFGIELPKGATIVLPIGKKFVARHGVEALGKVAKLHFKTTLKVLGS
ncbi:MAG: ribonuclease HIII, partial [Armatimonadota bacterium]